MERSPSKSLSFLFAALQIMAFTGLFVWMFMSFTVMQELVHALSYTSHALSFLARLMADLSIIPFVFSLGFSTTVVLIFLTSTSQNKKSRTEIFLRVFPYYYASGSLILLIIFLALWFLDLKFLPLREIDGKNPFQIVLITSMIITMLSLSMPILFAKFRRSLYLYILIVIPLLAIAFHMILFAGGSLEKKYSMALPILFPKLRWVGIAVAAIIIFHVIVIIHLKKRGIAVNPHHFVSLCTSLYSSALLALVSLGILLPFHLLLVQDFDSTIQTKAVIAISIFYIVLWVAIIFIPRKKQLNNGSAE